MLSAPKTPPPKCEPDCGCKVCRDVHVSWASRLNQNSAGSEGAREWWNSLNRTEPEPATDVDLDRFDADMNALTHRITGKETPA